MSSAGRDGRAESRHPARLRSTPNSRSSSWPTRQRSAPMPTGATPARRNSCGSSPDWLTGRCAPARHRLRAHVASGGRNRASGCRDSSRLPSAGACRCRTMGVLPVPPTVMLPTLMTGVLQATAARQVAGAIQLSAPNPEPREHPKEEKAGLGRAVQRHVAGEDLVRLAGREGRGSLPGARAGCRFGAKVRGACGVLQNASDRGGQRRRHRALRPARRPRGNRRRSRRSSPCAGPPRWVARPAPAPGCCGRRGRPACRP